jgi:hypothetical protein
MTVKELIEKLQACEPDLEVYVFDSEDMNFYKVKEVDIVADEDETFSVELRG